jgi:hypothetical protein
LKEFFYEESALIQDEKFAKIKYYIFKVMSIISYVLMGVWIFFVFYGYPWENILADIFIVGIPLALFLTSGIILGKLKNRFYVDYDYTQVSDSLRFSKVIKNSKRVFIIKFDISMIEKIGEYGFGLYEKYSTMPGVSKLILTANNTPSENKNFYYLVVNVNGDKKLIIHESTETFLVNIMKFANKTILDEEYVKKISKSR